MKAKLKLELTYDVRYLSIDAGVRYWEDADINGEQDDEIAPRMPFAVGDEGGYRWKVLIDVDKGQIVGWPKGTTAHVHYKVCDDGTYALLDSTMFEIASRDGYVPDCIGKYGDYIVLDIDEDGMIEDWSFTERDAREVVCGDPYEE